MDDQHNAPENKTNKKRALRPLVKAGALALVTTHLGLCRGPYTPPPSSDVVTSDATPTDTSAESSTPADTGSVE